MLFFIATYNEYWDNMAYISTCYDNLYNNTDPRCIAPTIPCIESTFDRNAPCPFAPSMCAGLTITIGSGLVDSDTKLVINSPVKD